MRNRFLSLTSVVLLLAAAMFAQDPTPIVVPATHTFSLSANAIALPGKGQTIAAAIVGGTFAVTEKFALRQDNIIANQHAMNGYYGGFQYELPAFSKKLNAISIFDATQLHFYVTGSAGVDHVGAVQHYSFLAGGGVNYGSGRVTMNLVELRWLRAPGFANNVPLLSSGVKLGF